MARGTPTPGDVEIAKVIPLRFPGPATTYCAPAEHPQPNGLLEAGVVLEAFIVAQYQPSALERLVEAMNLVEEELQRVLPDERLPALFENLARMRLGAATLERLTHKPAP